MAFDVTKLSFGKMWDNSSMYGALATAPPLPAPGRSVLDTLGFMQVYKHPMDIFFFHSWPEDITEGLTVQWAALPFMGATAPLAFVYEGAHWDDYEVSLDLHTSNPVLSSQVTSVLQNNLGSPASSSALPYFTVLAQLMRIQLQVAWCKSICLPRFGDLMTNMEQTFHEFYKGIEKEKTAQAAFDLIKGSVQNAGDFLRKAMKKIGKYGLYSGEVFPPLIATQYGGFLRMYGFCQSVQIQYLPPFTPLVGLPHRAKVTLSFKRFFPFNMPDRDLARSRFGWMM